ncbi:MAG: hypothetical protein JWN40_4913 [Phycisphaerales bacterium]|nr:hypothetical protein [Phycisphaerales bacterium]
MSLPLRTLLFLLLASLPALAEDAPKPATTQPAEQLLESAFTTRLTNAVMSGSYTMGNSAPKKDKYTIVSVRKLKEDNWLFQARVQFGDKDVTIPMIIPVKWAGDTPVISVTDLGFPGLGSYTARVVIYGDQYAGTWQDNNNKAHAGHLWGKIEKLPATQPATKP